MPITKQNLRAAMSYHELDPEQRLVYDRIEAAAIAFADVALEVLPPWLVRTLSLAVIERLDLDNDAGGD